MLTVFAAVAELEREYILQRQREGIGHAKQQGKYRGRPPKAYPDFERIAARWQKGRNHRRTGDEAARDEQDKILRASEAA